jgi:murein peptide amidase A
VADSLDTRTDVELAHRSNRLGRNVNGYRGETIEIGSVLAGCVAAARSHGWRVEEIGPGPETLFAFTRRGGSTHGGEPQAGRRGQLSRLYLSTGIHGDEPAGPLAMRQLLRENRWPAKLDIWMCPCLNPAAFPANRRENGDGLDLNREYRAPRAKETLAHIAWLQKQPSFDLCLCLHEDWESNGFYLYELNPDQHPSTAEDIVREVEKVCPIDCAEIIEGRPARGGIIRPSLDPRDRPQWPEAFFLLTHKTRHSYTFEAPSDFPLSTRVSALVAAVNSPLSG